MESIKKEYDFFKRLSKGIAEQFGSRCEVVVHDYSNELDASIVIIENGHVTKRKVGDCSTNLGLEVLRGTVTDGDRHGYFTQTKDGKILHSTSINIRNENEEIIGGLCINWDVTDFYSMFSFFNEIVGMKESKDQVNEVITNDVSFLLDELIKNSIDYVGKPVATMTKEDKIKGLKYLDSKGAFLIKKAGDRVTKFYDISKFTLYNYLEQGEENS